MEFITWLADEWSSLYFLHMLESSAFVALVYLADRAFSLETKMRYFLWLTALIKFFIPPFFSLPGIVQNPESAFYFTAHSIVSQTPNSVVTLQPPSIGFAEVFAALWLFSSMTFALLFFVQNLRLRGALKKAVPVRMSHPTFLHASWKKPDVFVSDQIAAPLLRGFSRPKLFLPADYTTWSNERLKSVLAHELAHFAYRDSWALALQCFAIILFGLNPVVWFAHRKLTRVREIRCDEAAIAQTGVSPTDYSKFLYSFLKKQSIHGKKPAFSGSYFAESKGDVMYRFKHILSMSENGVVRSNRRHRLVLAVIIAAVVPFSWQSQANEITTLTPPLAEMELTVASQDYDKPPQPEGGMDAILENLFYPRLARLERIEGRVIVEVLIDETGRITDTKIVKSLGQYGCDEAAILAVKSVRWKPARKDGKAVAGKVSVPVVFKLDSDSEEGDEFKDIPPPPPPGKSKKNIFVKYDSPPEPVGGFTAIQKSLTIPKDVPFEEGRVIVNVLVDTDGTVAETKILKGLGAPGYNQAAMDAIKAVKWKPAKQKEKPVKVWVGIPIIFKKS